MTLLADGAEFGRPCVAQLRKLGGTGCDGVRIGPTSKIHLKMVYFALLYSGIELLPFFRLQDGVWVRSVM